MKELIANINEDWKNSVSMCLRYLRSILIKSSFTFYHEIGVDKFLRTTIANADECGQFYSLRNNNGNNNNNNNGVPTAPAIATLPGTAFIQHNSSSSSKIPGSSPWWDSGYEGQGLEPAPWRARREGTGGAAVGARLPTPRPAELSRLVWGF